MRTAIGTPTDAAAVAAIDLLDPELHASTDLSPLWRWLRAHEPVRWQDTEDGERAGFWNVTRHADVLRVVRDPVTFTSAQGNMLGTLLRGGDPGAGRMLVVTDGPFHTALRRVLSAGFGPRFLGPVTRSIARATGELLAGLVARGGGDFVTEVAAQIPLGAICELLGVPEADRPRVLALTGAAMLTEPGARVDLEARIAQSEILVYYTRLAAERRDAPGSDIISLLVECTVDGRALTEEEILLNCYNLIIGGDETARLALAGGLLALADCPQQWDALRADPALVTPGTEEILRWTTPAAHVGRRVSTDTELGGRRLAAGDVVALWTVSANRDEQVFDGPDSFELGRRPNRHLTFGHGPHFCLGAQLARTEIQVLLARLRESVARIEVTGPVEWLASNFISGLRSLPVALTAAR